jgi:hypothetical protein
MGKKAGKHKRDMDLDPYDDFDNAFVDELDELSSDELDELSSDELAKDIFSTDWDHFSTAEDHSDVRRKIERREDMKKLYSQLNDWEEFGEHYSWYMQ